MPIWRKATEYNFIPHKKVHAKFIFHDGTKDLDGTGWLGDDGLFIWNLSVGMLPEYKIVENLFILDESEPSFSIENMRDAYDNGHSEAMAQCGGWGFRAEEFDVFMKELFNIEIKE